MADTCTGAGVSYAHIFSSDADEPRALAAAGVGASGASGLGTPRHSIDAAAPGVEQAGAEQSGAEPDPDMDRRARRRREYEAVDTSVRSSWKFNTPPIGTESYGCSLLMLPTTCRGWIARRNLI